MLVNPTSTYKKIQPQLERVDTERLRLYKKTEPFKYIFWGVCIVGGAYTTYIINFTNRKDTFYIVLGYAIFSLFFLIIYLFVKNINTKKYSQLFQEGFSTIIVRCLGNTFTYSSEKQLNDLNSKLITTPDDYIAREYIEGTIEQKKVTITTIRKSFKKSKNLPSGLLIQMKTEYCLEDDVWFIPKALNRYFPFAEDLYQIHRDVIQHKYSWYLKSEKSTQDHANLFDRISVMKKGTKDLKGIKSLPAFYVSKNQLEVFFKSNKPFLIRGISKTVDSQNFVAYQLSIINFLAPLVLREYTKEEEVI